MNTYHTSRYNTFIMRSTLLTTLLLALCFTFSHAQRGGKVKDRLRSERVAVYTQVLQLTSDEAQQFWPIFNQFIEEREKVQQELKNLKRDNLSDAEAEAQIKKQLELQQRDLDLEKDVIQKLRKVISLQKIIKIPDAEREFRQTVLARAKDKAQERKQRQN
jgi:hypothetical protein